MAIKEWLERVKNSKHEINGLKEAILEIEDRLYSVTGKIEGDRVQTNKTCRREAYLCRYIQLKSMLERRIAVLFALQRELIESINQLDDELYRHLLIQKYVVGKSVAQIAEEVCYTERWTAKLLSRAVCMLDKHVSQQQSEVNTHAS